ncbi:hypothetical protein F503_02057 [Ophiostoma piceae UAMH 11346]|uniref:Protein kinase domain-containing protein n=1 Tax=Ophiostoma piceae (strain UAMH 11346) TaxID=1262450 RepID=S3BPS6_OPHP1|nr:hypothetical protein F503_02057 [Ophiostoma piceae UAMH 11346]
MYPDWPETAADLVPQPLCPGPKLAAFDFQGPQDIEFLEYLGEGLHSHVLRVKIKGQEYALKLFRFGYDESWIGPGQYNANGTRAKLTVLAQYSEPFNAECRAFGRLQEAGYSELAIPCYGYILLDEENERRLQDKFNLEFNGDNEISEDDLRGRFLGERSGKPPPVRCIVKALGSTHARNDPVNFSVPMMRRLFRETVQLQQLGIFCHDTRIENLINDKLADFSTAITVPHFMTTPELNPLLTAKDIEDMELETFMRTMSDYWAYIEMLFFMDRNPAQRSKLLDKIPVLPGGLNPHLAKRLVLRDTPRRKLGHQRVFAMVDPRRYDWKATSAAAAETRGVRKRRPRKTLSAKPELWYLNCTPEEAIKFNNRRDDYHTTGWRVDDAGFVFPASTELGHQEFEDETRRKQGLPLRR